MDACEACKLNDRLRIELRHWCCAGLLSLTDMTKRLQQDHDNAWVLAKGLAACPHIDIRTDLVRKAIPALPTRLSLPMILVFMCGCCCKSQSGVALLPQ